MFGDEDGQRSTKQARRRRAPLNEDDQMVKTRYRATPCRQAHGLHQTAAILRYRAWDATMVRQYGPLYYRAMGYSVH